ncbi:MAG: hypothetical protein H6Q20_167 [Bacteroidetes bacterium]|nr:hypothetical protein [Bacteroidota bacterium]
MNMNRVYIFLIFIVLPIVLYGQRKDWTLGESSIVVTGGPSTLFIGDIGSPFAERFFNDQQRGELTNSKYSIGFHQVVNYDFGYKISVHTGFYGRQDAIYSFDANVFECVARAEYNLLGFTTSRIHYLYLYGGLGYMYSDYKLKTVAPASVAPVYGSASAPIVPVGLGYKINLFRSVALGAEIDMTYIFSDKFEGRGAQTSHYPHDITTTLSLAVYYHINTGSSSVKDCNCIWY